MQLVIYYERADCVCWNETHIPAIYSSSEALYCDLIERCEKAFKEKQSEFTIGGVKLQVDEFIYRDYDADGSPLVHDWPKVMTIDEWFEKSEKNKELIIEEIK